MSVLLRKSNMCKCGCRGWCTLYPVLFFLRRSFEALAIGKFWTERPDRLPWLSSDEGRECYAGECLAILGALTNIKCDWAEFAVTFAFPTWSSSADPCLLCDAEQCSMHALENTTLEIFRLATRRWRHMTWTVPCASTGV